VPAHDRLCRDGRRRRRGGGEGVSHKGCSLCRERARETQAASWCTPNAHRRRAHAGLLLPPRRWCARARAREREGQARRERGGQHHHQPPLDERERNAPRYPSWMLK
jgi:hypothetical protein